MKGKIGGIYKALQDLQLQPTPENCRTMTAVFNTLEEVYAALENMEREVSDHGAQGDPEPGE